MNLLSRLLYRLRQFRQAAFGPWQPVMDSSLSPYLSPDMIALYRQMRPSEQAHSYSVMQRLLAAGYQDCDLLAAALLHDVGKIRSPLSVLDRSLVVLGKRFLTGRIMQWSQGSLSGWQRPFVVAAHHPAWGADLVAAAGASPRTVELIRNHQVADAGTDPGLTALQHADENE